MGNFIPGIKIDGMDVLAVREGIKWAKEYCGSGKGPLYIEMSTYRYHGHSMSDPGITYRDRDEVAATRSTSDPIESLKNRLISSGLATTEEIKLLEKKVRGEVAEETRKAKAGKQPDVKELVTDIYSTVDGKNEHPPYIRMPNYENSQYFR
jgi:pyruvate dehydrogenase E1 component alpha subunit